MNIVLVFLSGMAGLIYEVAWIRRASLAFGSSSLAFSSVLAVFFLGLGLGGWWFGRRAESVRRPMLWCAAIEVLLAGYGVLTPLLFDQAESVFGLTYREFNPDAGALLALRVALLTLLLLPPTWLMGGTLPLFCRQWVRSSNEVAGGIGRLYGGNTLGATAGAALAGFLLLPSLGVKLALCSAAGINVLAGLGFWFLGRGQPTFEPAPAGNSASEVKAPVDREWLLPGVLFFLIGAVALANEVIWARFLSHFLRNSVYTYTLSLSMVLAGTALGSLWAGRRFDRHTDRRALLGQFALLQSISVLATLILTHLPASAWQALRPLNLVPFVVLMLPSALISGACFPLINRIVTTDHRQVPRSLGRLVALNIGGCIAGSLLAGYGLLPEFGLDASVQIVCAWGLTAAVLACLAVADESRLAGSEASACPQPGEGPVKGVRRRGPLSYAPSALGIAGTALALLVLLTLPWWSPVRIPRDYLDTHAELVDFAEGYNSSLAVTRKDGIKVLLIDRLWQGVDQRNYQVMVAHIPMFHMPEAKDVLLVGLGTGTTASRFLYYDIARLDVVDIEPRLFDFTARNFPAQWRQDSRVRLVAEDGRNYVKHTGQQYDLVSVEIGQPDRPGVAAFYTREFYEEARERLRENGMISQFVPLRFLRPRDFAAVLKTFLTVFPKAQLWYNTNELLLLGFKGQELPLSYAEFQRLTRDRRIGEDINMYHWNPAYPLTRFTNVLSGFLASGTDLAALAKIVDAPVYSDDTLALGYAVADYQRSDLRTVALVPNIHQHLSPMTEALTPGSRDESIEQRATQLRDYNVADMAASDIIDLLENGVAPVSPEAALAQVEQALRWNPINVYAQRWRERLIHSPNGR